MSKTLRYASVVWVLGAVVTGWAAGCLDNGNIAGNPTGTDSGNAPDTTSPQPHPDGGRDADARATASESGPPSDASVGDGPGVTYVLIDDMETTTHGPIQLAGINPPLTPGYWFNFGASGADADTADPPVTVFTFTALPSPTTTLNGKMSTYAAHQRCALNGQYDVCGLGFEFAQVPAPDAGDAGEAGAARVDAGSDGGDAAPPIPRVTVPFDISQYTGIVFWGKATAAGDAGALDIKVQFPDTDTDPRGGVCNGAGAGASGPNDTSQCYNSYAVHETFTGDWQAFTVRFSDLTIDPNFGYQMPGAWDGKKVYGINWQGQKNSLPDAGAVPVDFWIDDVYFIQ